MKALQIFPLPSFLTGHMTLHGVLFKVIDDFNETTLSFKEREISDPS